MNYVITYWAKESEKQQYLGANAHFAIFLTRLLFKKRRNFALLKLVETSKLWGRIVAEVEPDGLSRGKHLVKKSYSEPHWSKSKGAVLASEKVSLYGIPIVVNRLVNYGNIDPVTVVKSLFSRH